MAFTDLLTNLLFKKKTRVTEPGAVPAKNEKEKKITPKRDDKRPEIKLTIQDLENTIRKQKDCIAGLKEKLADFQKTEGNIQAVQNKLAAEERKVSQKIAEYSEYLKKPINPAQKQEVEKAVAALQKNLAEFRIAISTNQKTLEKITKNKNEAKKIIDINQRALSENERSLKLAIAAEGKVEIKEKGIEELEKQYLPEKEEGNAEEVTPPVQETQPPTAVEIPQTGIPAETPIAPPSLRAADDDYWKKGRIITDKKN